MSNYRPITDNWILARAKLKEGAKYYGAWPGGFLERGRALLGVHITDSVLFVCGGQSRLYPYRRGFGPNDKTLDLDPNLKPDYLRDAREPLPEGPLPGGFWAAVIIDRPYTETDAEKYAPGPGELPAINLLLKNALLGVRPGGRVGILDYILPKPPPASVGFETIFVAKVGVDVGFNNRSRTYSVFEREWRPE